MHGLVLAFMSPGALFARASAGHKSAVHAMPHGYNCGSIATFADYSRIIDEHADSGDTYVLPVIFGLTDYLAVGSGLTLSEGSDACGATEGGTGDCSLVNVHSGRSLSTDMTYYSAV
jgi:hypothetical protein